MVVFNDHGVAQVNPEDESCQVDKVGEYFQKLVLEKTASIRGYCIVTCGNTTLAHNFTLPVGLFSRVDNPVAGKAVADPLGLEQSC